VGGRGRWSLVGAVGGGPKNSRFISTWWRQVDRKNAVVCVCVYVCVCVCEWVCVKEREHATCLMRTCSHTRLGPNGSTVRKMRRLTSSTHAIHDYGSGNRLHTYQQIGRPVTVKLSEKQIRMLFKHSCWVVYLRSRVRFSTCRPAILIDTRECIQKFPDWVIMK